MTAKTIISNVDLRVEKTSIIRGSRVHLGRSAKPLPEGPPVVLFAARLREYGIEQIVHQHGALYRQLMAAA